MLPFPGWSGRGVRPFFIQYLLMKKILQWMASPRLACVLMAYAVLLIFLGTLEARSVGVSAVQARYFESWGCLSFGMIPLIGGAGVGALAVLNISASVFRRGLDPHACLSGSTDFGGGVAVFSAYGGNTRSGCR